MNIIIKIIYFNNTKSLEKHYFQHSLEYMYSNINAHDGLL